ncbi:unnamed protein product [Lactuca saligna]|uniref:Uncharacterized protein n=1 Tax=Lactuca saligna TaxID=75948 RepID=A0AA35YPW4_LACSI|nr:unnamed protein product [Lactuca saligna]
MKLYLNTYAGGWGSNNRRTIHLLKCNVEQTVYTATLMSGAWRNERNVERVTVSFNRADVLRENTEAVFAACDAAHGRWAKLLGVRALLHPRLRLKDFLQIYNVSRICNCNREVLDQETWVEVDVPNEFQGIVDSLFSLESLGVVLLDKKPDEVPMLVESVLSNVME